MKVDVLCVVCCAVSGPLRRCEGCCVLYVSLPPPHHHPPRGGMKIDVSQWDVCRLPLRTASVDAVVTDMVHSVVVVVVVVVVVAVILFHYLYLSFWLQTLVSSVCRQG